MPVRSKTKITTTRPKTRATAATSPAAALAEFSLSHDRLVGTAGAAALVGLSPKTLRQLRADRSGPRCLKMGAGKQARVLYRVSDLEAWVRSSVSAIGGDA